MHDIYVLEHAAWWSWWYAWRRSVMQPLGIIHDMRAWACAAYRMRTVTRSVMQRHTEYHAHICLQGNCLSVKLHTPTSRYRADVLWRSVQIEMRCLCYHCTHLERQKELVILLPLAVLRDAWCSQSNVDISIDNIYMEKKLHFLTTHCWIE